VTIVFAGSFLVDQHTQATALHEAVPHARPASDNSLQLTAKASATKAYLAFQRDQNQTARWLFRIWVALPLIGAALFAKKSSHLISQQS
jgi:hypothetical protein